MSVKDAGPSSLPSDKSISAIAKILISQTVKVNKDKQYAKVKDVLSLLGTGVMIPAAILAPNSVRAFGPMLTQSRDWEEWKHFNTTYLQRTLQRLEQRKIVEIVEQNGQQIIALTKNGKRKILRYSIESLSIEKPKRWDGKWRLVTYDVPTRDKHFGDVIRGALRTLGFYTIQDSVYIYPYDCFDQIEFLREYYYLGDDVQYMVVERLERDAVFKTYFNLS